MHLYKFYVVLQGNRQMDFKSDVREAYSTDIFKIEYFVNCTWDAARKQLFLIAGNHEYRIIPMLLLTISIRGTIGVFEFLNESLRLLSTCKGHSGTVRAFNWNPQVFSFHFLFLSSFFNF